MERKALLATQLQHAPVYDSSFMKKEQSNGNLCCIKSAKENVHQACRLALWIPEYSVLSSSGIKEAKECRTPGGFRNQHQPMDDKPLALPLAILSFPPPRGTSQLISQRDRFITCLETSASCLRPVDS